MPDSHSRKNHPSAKSGYLAPTLCDKGHKGTRYGCCNCESNIRLTYDRTLSSSTLWFNKPYPKEGPWRYNKFFVFNYILHLKSCPFIAIFISCFSLSAETI